jgi:hypothetical protein
MNEGRYEGPVVFVEGAHYPVGEDGHAVKDQTLLWVADSPHEAATADASGEGNPGGGYYRWSAEGDQTHFALYHVNHAELDFGNDEPVRVSPDEAEAVKALLRQLRGEA